MTDILLDWINKEVKLSKNIQNIAEDFSNGYFFAELLININYYLNLSIKKQ